MNDPKIIVALDYPDATSALNLVTRLDPTLCRLKVGMELFTVAGPKLVENLMQKGFEVFLDLKFHDIPNTVKQACRAAAELGVWMVNVHALGGRRMMMAAKEGLSAYPKAPKLIAVTVLTSMSQEDLDYLGIMDSPADMVVRLAKLSKDSGMDGVVCSAQEATLIRQHCGNGFCLVTPGIRLVDSATDDQSRVMTPSMAIKHGADYLVIGRPITRAADPLQALNKIIRMINK